MEKLDLTIAVVAALVLVAALGIVALQRGAAGIEVSFVEREMGIGEGNRQHFGEGSFTDVYAFEIADRAVTRLNVSASTAYLTVEGAPQPAMRAVLRAPNGTAYEAEATGAPGPSGAGGASVQLVVEAAPAPARVVVGEASEEAALEAARAQAARGAAVGTWTLEVSFSAGAVAVNSATSSWEGRMVSWEPRAGRGT